MLLLLLTNCWSVSALLQTRIGFFRGLQTISGCISVNLRICKIRRCWLFIDLEISNPRKAFYMEELFKSLPYIVEVRYSYLKKYLFWIRSDHPMPHLPTFCLLSTTNIGVRLSKELNKKFSSSYFFDKLSMVAYTIIAIQKKVINTEKVILYDITLL